MEYNGTSSTTTSVAKYWKNGNVVNLTNGSTRALVFSIAATTNDVYVAGFEFNSLNIEVAKYWKDGTAVSLTDGAKNARATAIAVSGNDVMWQGMKIMEPSI